MPKSIAPFISKVLRGCVNKIGVTSQATVAFKTSYGLKNNITHERRKHYYIIIFNDVMFNTVKNIRIMENTMVILIFKTSWKSALTKN